MRDGCSLRPRRLGGRRALISSEPAVGASGDRPPPDPARSARSCLWPIAVELTA